jgi:hypothetical protein
MTNRKNDPGVIPSVENTPRQRVLDLVRRMAKATALGGAALGLASAESCTPLVCDPLPPPITCANPTHAELQQAMNFTAQWVSGDGGAPQVQLSVSNFGRQQVTFSSTVTATGATVVGVSTTDSSLTADLAPTSGATSATVSLNFDCAGTTDAMTLRLDLGGSPTVGAPVTVTLTAP